MDRILRRKRSKNPVHPEIMSKKIRSWSHATTQRRNAAFFRSVVASWRETKSAPFRKTRFLIQTMPQLFAILLLLQTLPNPTHIANATPCATHVQPPRNPAPMHPDCNLADLFPPGFSQAWIADSLCDRHFRLHQRKVFFPNRNIGH